MALHLRSDGVYFGDFDNTGGETSELFDDYEEGTFTPEFHFQNGTQESNKAFTVQEGAYVKNGQMCVAEFRVIGTYSGGNQDNVNGGFPFSHYGGFDSTSGGPGVIVTGNGQNFPATAVYLSDNTANFTFASTHGTGNYTQSMPTSYNVMAIIPFRTNA